MQYIHHSSQLDNSVNFVAGIDDKQKIECRYVKRPESDYFIVYVSSQTGCAQACRMCHLTSTGQNLAQDVSIVEMLHQADLVLEHFEQIHRDQPGLIRPSRVHFNFMARGEPLASRELVENAPALFEGLEARAKRLSLEHEFLISTIVPTGFAEGRGEGGLVDLFGRMNARLPAIYYSLYSMDPAVRKKWLPRATDPSVALPMLKAYQDAGGLVKVHFAFIEGVNDRDEDVDRITEALARAGVICDFNIVRYNPYDARYGREACVSKIEALKARIETALGNTVKVIPKVGFDVKASCGMFVSSTEVSHA